LASTWVTKPKVHVEQVTSLVKMGCKNLVAKKVNYAGKAAANGDFAIAVAA